MAAPTTNITWGDIAGGYGRIGIYHTLSSTNTETTLTVEVWFWSKYSVSDNLGNALYLDNLASSGSATTDRGGTNIQTKVATGSGWSTSNQVKLTSKSYTWTHTRGTSASTRYIYAKLTGVDRVGATMYASKTVSIPALANYTISYSANGGSGAPSSQTKYYGKNLTLSSTTPTRTGHTFKGWATSASGSVAYLAGANYTANSGATLYAVWEANKYPVNYNANGGTGAPASQEKTYGQTLTLSNIIPTRENYTFKGWGTSASATTATYQAKAAYTADATVTLYAVWELAYAKPRIKNFRAFRCDAETTAIDDNGTALGVSFEWATDQSVREATLSWTPANGGGRTATTLSVDSFPDKSGVYETQSADTGFNLETTYQVALTIRDGDGDCYNVAFATLPGANFVVDFKAGGDGVAFGKPAELSGVLDVDFKAHFRNGFVPVVLPPEKDLNDVMDPNTYIGANLTNYKYHCGGEKLPFTTGTFSLEVVGMGEDGQIKQRITYCHKTTSRAWERLYHSTNDVKSWGDWVCVSDFDGQLLWSGGYYMQASHDIALSEPVSKQRSGIVLVFSEYFEGVVRDYGFATFYIPKHTISKHGDGTGNTYNFVMSGGLFGYIACKNLYITDTHIKGHEFNTQAGTGESGIKYDNKKFVLRYVIGI